jgi:Putative Flp pilus-assembly TadE/G-like
VRRLRQHGGESGQVTLLVLGFAVVVMVLVTGSVAATSAQLSRMRLIDAADGAALDAADSLDAGTYDRGVGDAVPLSDSTVTETARAYLAERRRPESLLSWGVAPGTGTPDGETAVVRITGQADVPMVGWMLEELGGSLTITVEARARATVTEAPG